MDPTLSGFALGLLFAAAKIGAIGTIGFAVVWWRTRSRLRRLEAALPDPAQLAERLACIEQTTEFTASQVERLVEIQETLTRRLALPLANTNPPERQ